MGSPPPTELPDFGPLSEEASERLQEFYLEQIASWRSGGKATPGMPSTGERYALSMRLGITDCEKKLIALGHAPTIAYVTRKGFCEGLCGRYVPTP